ncbi:hypothetical protein AB0L53_43995 [Nonomuraea sp. NPDC052129]|uniref:hypothetical protein n=1 Tax=Nonomuraea sp. NPDC052129 TaxID=3154651 RepID=UPI00342B87C7
MPTAVLLALAAAALYGASDFLGGLLSRRTHYALVGLIGQSAAAIGGLAAVVLRERTSLAHAAGLLLCAASVGAFAAG